jgi:hypothetical protein
MTEPFDPRQLVEPQGETTTALGAYRWFGIAPGVLYPAALADLVLTGQIGIDDRRLAEIPRDDPCLGTPELLERRAELLEQARRHFHERLIEQLGAGVGLHIYRDLAWRL